MNDMLNEPLFSLNELSRELADQRGICRSYASLRRDASIGAPNRFDDSKMIVLETVMIGQIAHSSIQAFIRFLDGINARPCGQATAEQD